ncbi:MAG: DUF4153 domain-containing protein [Pirellula sp.]
MQSDLSPSIDVMDQAPESNLDVSHAFPWPYLWGALFSVLLGGIAYLLWAKSLGPTGFASFLIITICVVGAFRSMATEPLGNAIARRSYFWLMVSLASLVIGCLRMVWQANALVCMLGVVHVVLIASFWHSPMSGPNSGPMAGPIRLLSETICDFGYGLMRWISLPWGRLCMSLTGTRWPVLSLGVPLLVGVGFLIPMIQSDPDLALNMYRSLSQYAEDIVAWLVAWNLGATVIVVLVCIWSLGLLIPFPWSTRPPVLRDHTTTFSDNIYIVARNTLITVGLVFVWFLTHEFRTMWFRSFPEGFRYSAYAHEGAAWLTMVLGMSTVLLSVIFQSGMQNHPKVRSLYLLAAFWSLCNLVLAVAVVHRLNIYVGYNGLTRMRIIAFVGVGCVIAGFVLVQWKIANKKSFEWLFRSELWILLLGLYLLSLLPMDTLAHRWNVACVESGKPAACVQIQHQPMSDEGLLVLIPLIGCDEPILRDGVRGMLAMRMNDASESTGRSNVTSQEGFDWRSFQGSKYALEASLETIRPSIEAWMDSNPNWRSAPEELRNWSSKWY